VFRDYFIMGAWLGDKSCVIPVAHECRLSFERAFGWSPEEQLDAENSFAGFVSLDMPVVEGVKPSLWWEAQLGVYDTYRDARIFLDW
jgi:hypothetical protein